MRVSYHFWPDFALRSSLHTYTRNTNNEENAIYLVPLDEGMAISIEAMAALVRSTTLVLQMQESLHTSKLLGHALLAHVSHSLVLAQASIGN